MKKNQIKIVAGIVVVAGLTFFAGLSYGKGSASPQVQTGQLGSRNFGGQSQGGMMRGGQAGNFAGGEIISLDDKSITVKLRDGSSKIVFLSGATEILKFATGTISDLSVNEQVTVSGLANNDGSITAQSIQIRPQAIRAN